MTITIVDNHHDDKDVNAQNNAFILDEEDKAKEQRDIKEHYSNDDVHNGSHDLSNHNDNNRYDNKRNRSNLERNDYQESNRRDDLHRSNEDFNRRNDVEWSSDDRKDNNFNQNQEHNHNHDNEERSQFGSRSDRYQDEAHKDLNDFDKIDIIIKITTLYVMKRTN